MSNPKQRQLANEWFTIAESDLSYAKLGLGEDNFYAQISFNAQQAAEKYLKGFLILHGRKFRKTHDLVELISLCKEIDSFFEEIREFADTLAPYAVDVRYPVHYQIVKKEYAGEAISAAENIIEFIKGKIKN